VGPVAGSGSVGDGLTSGVYQLQVRTRETDEVPGSTVRYSEIRYAQNGVELIGLPKSSPLLGEAMEDEWVAERETGFFFGNTASNEFGRSSIRPVRASGRRIWGTCWHPTGR
jgi:hypothetical protein